MVRIDEQYIKGAFQDYVSAYNSDDSKIRLKINHTYRVADLSRQIAESAFPEGADLVWLAGILHDIGRFEQIRRYGTFADADSVDHACFGADLLFKEGLFEKFVPDWQDTLTAEEYRILEISIRNHNRFRLQDGLSEKEERYCNILRDADKVDIFRVNWDTPMEEIYNVTTRELKQAEITEEVKESFRRHTAVLRALKKTPVDHLVGHICLVYELCFPVSRKIVKEQGYLWKLLGFESDHPGTREWFQYMRQEMAGYRPES